MIQKSRKINIFNVLKFKYLNKISAIIYDDKITTIYCTFDEFCKEFDNVIKDYALKFENKIRSRTSVMSQIEVLTIVILFHYGAFKNLRHFYQGYVQRHMKKEFRVKVSCNRFVELQIE